MRTDEIDLRDGTLAMADGQHDSEATPDRGEDLLPLSAEVEPSATFGTVLRGYNKVQVEDYLDRVELALSEADQRHAEDGQRFASYEAELAALQERLELAEQRAAGQPEPASLVGERLTAMLSLAEQEAAALRQAAAVEADRIVGDARRSAERQSAERLAALEIREREVDTAQEAADRTRLEAQTDADQLRETTRLEVAQLLDDTRATADRVNGQAEQDAASARGHAQDDAEAARAQADDDVRAVHDQARRQQTADVEYARQQVEDLARQRDAIAAQMQSLRDQLTAIAGPLGQQPG